MFLVLLCSPIVHLNIHALTRYQAFQWGKKALKAPQELVSSVATVHLSHLSAALLWT